jgi:hypothetical protein
VAFYRFVQREISHIRVGSLPPFIIEIRSLGLSEVLREPWTHLATRNKHVMSPIIWSIAFPKSQLKGPTRRHNHSICSQNRIYLAAIGAPLMRFPYSVSRYICGKMLPAQCGSLSSFHESSVSTRRYMDMCNMAVSAYSLSQSELGKLSLYFGNKYLKQRMLLFSCSRYLNRSPLIPT